MAGEISTVEVWVVQVMDDAGVYPSTIHYSEEEAKKIAARQNNHGLDHSTVLRAYLWNHA